MNLAAEDVDDTIAVLVQTHRAVWEETGLPTRPGSPLPPGRLMLKSGFAQIEFYSGATVSASPLTADLRRPWWHAQKPAAVLPPTKVCQEPQPSTTVNSTVVACAGDTCKAEEQTSQKQQSE